jgi:cytochrome c oxidase subunit 2
MTIRSRVRLKPAALVGGLALLLSACARTNIPQDTFNAAGPAARREAHLFWIVFWIAVVVFVLVEGVLVLALYRFRHRPGRGTPVQVHGNTRLELTWTAVPFLLLVFVAILTIPAIFAIAAKPSGHVLNIEVTGHQWWWEVDYTGMNVVTANEVHIPTGRPVYLTLKSVDVIHSFWVPRLAGTQDMEPGRVNHLTIEAPQPGVYDGQCKEFCGASHANMRFRVIAQTESDFQAWLAHESQNAATPAAGTPAEQGQQLFEGGRFLGGQMCTNCHTTMPSIGGTVGPNLTHFGSRTTFGGGTFKNTTDDLALWLKNPGAIKPGVDMPYLGLSPDQINALVAYLETIK